MPLRETERVNACVCVCVCVCARLYQAFDYFLSMWFVSDTVPVTKEVIMSPKLYQKFSRSVWRQETI